MSSHERVPNELWLEMFELLPQESLKHIYATDRKFASASRALLFRLVFTPYHHRDLLGKKLSLPTSDEVALALERLEFWSSDKISPLVRECTLSPRHRRATKLSEPTDSPHMFMISFLDRLGGFTRLQKFSARQVDFTQAGLANLCQLPLLRRS